ncbi:AgmX/PglI C-terminal domain-containing protein [Microbulbifer sp. OS29]|uniref:AgmX/PglI C-terminal domain-containing protein n=1 Tax=Microbulbifer okhotskensis TaxID=2926617 RepID=A0A9X2J388_9GAMM|nr:AgmX/PglI C-terminal domain-containing protein [Microbulbifer okhotskensis]MCO1332758.1 AgmX/PglI C-terminal domain-containing protein [Microbulbifer okhotskensis]
MSTATMSYAPWQLQETVLPWSASKEEDQRFIKLLRGGLIALAISGIAIALIPVPELTREQAEKVPPQLAKVILEKKELPKAKPKAKPKEKKKPEEKRKPEETPKPKKEVREKPKPVQKPRRAENPPAVEVQQAREKAANSGLNALADDLLDMRDSFDSSEVNRGQLSNGNATAAKTERNMIGDKSKASSGGVIAGKASRDTGGTSLTARQTTQVKNVQAAGSAKETARAVRGQKSIRTDDSIRSIMEANKEAIIAIYNRALRKDPTLQGRLTVQLAIAPNGSIASIKLVESELNNSALERKILARIRMINFGTANVESTTKNYSIDFLPS